jgi:competence protein ComEC
MAVRGDKDFGEGSGGPRRPRDSLILIALAAAGRALEAEADRWFVWLPVLFAGGIVTYFALENEPDPRVAVALVTGALGLCLALRAAPLGLAIGGASLAFALGFADAKLRTEMARAPVLSHELRYVPVTGFIENHELRDKGRARLTLRVIALDDLQQANRPYRVRLTLPAKGDLIDQTGAVVTLKATLQPPPEPVEPGGFDFARQAWFARFGGTGYATSKIELAEDGREPPWDIAAWAAIDGLRVAINHRIRAALPGETGEIAVALITGEQGGISQETKQAMRDSGLAHILSISGLHMVIMGRHGVLARAGAARIVASTSAQLPHQEMGRRRGARRVNLLSRFIGRRRSDRPLVDHDEHRAHRDDARPPRAHHAQRRPCRASHSDRRP